MQTLDRVDTVTSENVVDIYGLRLIAFILDDGISETNTVYTDMTVSLLYVEKVTLGNDVQSVDGVDNILFNNDKFPASTIKSRDGGTILYSCHDPERFNNCRAIQSGDGVTIHYTGVLDLNSKKSVGDTVDITVEYGDQSRTVSAVVEES